MFNRFFVFIIAFWIIVFDQLSKQVVSNQILFAQNITIFKNILSFTKIYNTGAAFSILQKNSELLVLFSLIVTCVIIFYFLFKAKNLSIILCVSWGLILGGTVGNLIDRILYGYVIDFIKLDFINFPIFNLADLSINMGAFLIFLNMVMSPRKKSPNN